MSHFSTLQSTWTNGQSQTYQGTGTFTFTYDDAIPADTVGGTATHPNASYKNAISAATFVFNNLELSLDKSRDNTVSIYVLDGAGTDASIRLPLLDTNNTPYWLEMKFEDANRDLSNYALSNLVGLLATENATFLWPAGNQTNPGKHALYQQTPLTSIGAPMPPGNVRTLNL